MYVHTHYYLETEYPDLGAFISFSVLLIRYKLKFGSQYFATKTKHESVPLSIICDGEGDVHDKQVHFIKQNIMGCRRHPIIILF